MYELEALTAPRLRALIDAGVSIVVVPFGSIEHHGAHLPLGADALLADAVGREVATRLDAVRAPTVRVGDAAAHQDQPGTLTHESATLGAMAFELGVSLARNGFRVLALISGHGGNAAALQAAAQRLTETIDGVAALAPRGDVGPEPGSHSGEWLTSVMLALHPELVDLDAVADAVASEVRTASAERGAAHFERFVSAIVEEVRSAAARLSSR